MHFQDVAFTGSSLHLEWTFRGFVHLQLGNFLLSLEVTAV